MSRRATGSGPGRGAELNRTRQVGLGVAKGPGGGGGDRRPGFHAARVPGPCLIPGPRLERDLPGTRLYPSAGSEPGATRSSLPEQDLQGFLEGLSPTRWAWGVWGWGGCPLLPRAFSLLSATEVRRSGSPPAET